MTVPAQLPKAFLVDHMWQTSDMLTGTGDVVIRILYYRDGRMGVEHECRIVDGWQLIVAPKLQLNAGHTVVNLNPLTIQGSVLCPDCGLHGFIREGAWVGV